MAVAKRETLLDAASSFPLTVSRLIGPTDEFQSIDASFLYIKLNACSVACLVVLIVLKPLFEPKVPAVFLKQFRDASDGTRACYQAIIELSLPVTGFRIAGSGLLPGQYEARVAQFASHPLQTDLGLPDGPIAARLPFVVNIDFESPNGTTMWSATSHV